MQIKCKTCQRPVTPDDIGCTKKLKNRGATEFFCISCLAKEYGVAEEVFFEMIDRWRNEGCTLFASHFEK